MSTRMIISVSFALAVVFGMLVYVLNDNNRGAAQGNKDTEDKARLGAQLFGANCSQCHGPKGEGAIGPAVNRPEWRAETPGFDLPGATSVIQKVLLRGQYSPQPGIQMPAWGKDFGGPFNDQQIDEVMTFLIYGNWDEALEYTSSPNFVADLPPNDVLKAQYPIAGTDAMNAKYPNAKTDKAQADAMKAESDKNAEAVRLFLGNNKPGEQLNGLKQLIQSKGCLNCHAIGSVGSTLGPILTEVGSRRTADWLYKWIEDPSKMPPTERGPNLQPWFAADNRTKYWPMNPTFMPTIQMTQQERQRIVDYLKDLKVAQVKITQ